MQLNNKFLGFTSAIFAAMLWGVSGAFAQFLFREKEFNAEWLVTVRLLISGVLMLLFGIVRKNPDVVNIWKDKKDAVQLILFSILGMLTVQYTYFVTILHSNAATATVIQYTGPVFIAIYLALRLRKWPKPIEFLAIGMAMLGTFLLVTHGDINTLNITPTALVWGIASAIALAVYTLMPVHLLNRYSPIAIIGWSMLIAGIAMSIIHPPHKLEGIWDTDTYLAVLFIIFLGTLIPFYIFLMAIKNIGPQRASLLACAEPLSATLIAVVYFGVNFELMDYIGSLCIITTIFLLTKIKKKVIPEN
ncbi:EamA family transporter [Myroides odoratimimus]|uniref:DMT family transporter n=1 Tax=Myroides odoratimimus TaxID=76832 RepID=UPI0010392A5C|nr:DMT family transporter [Myroides odoratimimus]MCA4791801.1 EamA family transporter [Myroides odoratimimus]MCA4805654.1 EamA family transporter [Myroides odoratimimus]MCA4819062.1 EamA family transporter [Myroides odoratimimus]MDM1059169.1 EamA family transporter [Myroides odoratimimus]MDM1091743.1 EamA family transporter [Myroides odoratimimus]